MFSLRIAGFAQLVEHLTAEWEVTGSFPETWPILRVFKELRNEGFVSTEQTATISSNLLKHLSCYISPNVGSPITHLQMYMNLTIGEGEKKYIQGKVR